MDDSSDSADSSVVLTSSFSSLPCLRQLHQKGPFSSRASKRMFTWEMSELMQWLEGSRPGLHLNSPSISVWT